MANVTLRDIVKVYGEFVAIKGIDLDIEDGTFVVLVGPSGCGKSTLLRMIADILPPTSGSITIGGHTPNSARLQHEIGFVFQDPTLLPWRSVIDNIRLPLEVVGKSGRLSGASPQELIDLVGLTGFEHARPAQLSGGMQQRVALARALAPRPRLLMLDEPTEGLAPVIIQQIGRTIARLKQEGFTILLVEQNFRFASTVADRYYVMEHGKIIDGFANSELEANMPKLHEYLGV